jgi:hypothetical protein
MSKFASEDIWRPDVRVEREELLTIIRQEIRGLSLIEKKLLMLGGIEL